MKISIIAPFLLAGSLVVVSCKSESESKTSNDSSSTTEQAPDTGNRFYDAAVKKFMIGPPKLDLATAKQIVDILTADGSIGLGEVNSIDLVAPNQNSDRLNSAVEQARKKVATP